MLVFLKRHIISISLLILCTAIGFVFYMKETPVDIWRIEYEFRSEDQSKLQKIAQVDTLFKHGEIVCRNFTGSIADTLKEQGIRRFELKVYMKEASEQDVVQLGEELLENSLVNVINHRYRETQKVKRKILYWMLFGLFLGMIVEFIVALMKKPRSHQSHH